MTRLAHKLEISRVSLQTLRAYYATRLRELLIHPNVISALMGNSPGVLQDHYFAVIAKSYKELDDV